MLIACPECHRQYDVGALEPGKKIRCYCGALSEVPNQQSHDLEMLHCAKCGGDIQRDDRECGYCGSELALADKGVGDACPACLARLVKGAQFCSTCGTAIRPQTIRKAPTNTDCPRCQAPLSICEIPGGSFTECTGCGGIWLEEASFHGLTKDKETSSLSQYFPAAAGADALPASGRRSTEKLVKYLACPECGDMMNRKNFARCSGVIIDWCKGHGYWFDTDELELIVAFIQKGGLEKSRRREIEESKRKAKRARESARSAARSNARMHGSAAGMGMGGGGLDGFGGHSGGSIIHLLAGVLGALFD